MLSHLDRELQELLARAKAQGTLTYEEVSRFLPDETLGTDRIDEVLNALDGLGIELVDGPDAHKRALKRSRKAECRRRPRVCARTTACRPARAIRSACTSRRWRRFRC